MGGLQGVQCLEMGLQGLHLEVQPLLKDLHLHLQGEDLLCFHLVHHLLLV